MKYATFNQDHPDGVYCAGELCLIQPKRKVEGETGYLRATHITSVATSGVATYAVLPEEVTEITKEVFDVMRSVL